jgi:hypothetical protein
LFPKTCCHELQDIVLIEAVNVLNRALRPTGVNLQAPVNLLAWVNCPNLINVEYFTLSAMNFETPNIAPHAVPPPSGLMGLVNEQLAERLVGLSHIETADQEVFVSALTQCNQKTSLYFFPFLHSFARAPNQPLLWERVGSSVCVYMLTNIHKAPNLRLYLPPFPFNRDALRWAEDRQRNYNGTTKCVIVWADQTAGPELMEQGYRLAYRESEYIYDGDLVRAADGSNFSRLRRNLSRVRKLEGLIIRAYGPDDQAACLELLARWRKRRSDQGLETEGYGYTRRIVQHASEFKNGLLRGEVVLIKEKLVGFSFGGQITPDMECIFIAISDHDIASLGYTLRHSFVSNGPQRKLFNDGEDGGNSGIREVKLVFCPVEMNHLYRAFLG